MIDAILWGLWYIGLAAFLVYLFRIIRGRREI